MIFLVDTDFCGIVMLLQEKLMELPKKILPHDIDNIIISVADTRDQTRTVFLRS